jgi:16S rRNA (cytidine1402-2'-O)-methyltransferase
MQGRLSLVGTPIGNLGDITLRAIECLKEADRIYAEDTRRTRVLLSHLGIEGKRLLSYHAHSSERAAAGAVEIMREGHNIVLVTDAGMPGVSDPGAALVRAVREAGLELTVIPGPSAVTAAVALSGLVDGPFTFLGFLPRKGTKRADSLRFIAQSQVPVILFESPHRVNDTLKDLREVCGPQRRVAISREITKKYEETLLLSLDDATGSAMRETWQGEFTLTVERSHETVVSDEEFDIDERAKQLLGEGASVKDVAQTLSKELTRRGEKVPRRELYARVLGLTEDSTNPEPSLSQD